MERFLRTEHLIGPEGLARLTDTLGVVVGLGAVGGYALETVARSGVGRLRLVDFDTVDVTNINRQILALESTIGRKKTDAAVERVRDINPDCRVESLDLYVHQDTIEEVLKGDPDFVIDAIDSVTPKMVLLETCWKRGIPVFSSMGAALKIDPSKITTGDIMDTSVCSLARHMRRGLKKREVGRGIQCVYSTEAPREIRDKRVYDDHVDQSTRNVLGSLPGITGLFGMTLGQLAVNSVLHIIIK